MFFKGGAPSLIGILGKYTMVPSRLQLICVNAKTSIMTFAVCVETIMQVFIRVARNTVISGSCALKADTNRTKESKKWKIPHKFINDDFVNFLSFLIPLGENHSSENQKPITGENSLQEWANDYQLRILHSIDLRDILKLLEEKGYAEIHENENYIQYFTQDIARLIAEIRARIK